MLIGPVVFFSTAHFRRVPKPQKSSFSSKKKFEQSQNLQKSLNLNENFWRWGPSIHDNRVEISKGSINSFRLWSQFSKVSQIAEIVIRAEKSRFFNHFKKMKKNKLNRSVSLTLSHHNYTNNYI